MAARQRLPGDGPARPWRWIAAGTCDAGAGAECRAHAAQCALARVVTPGGQGRYLLAPGSEGWRCGLRRRRCSSRQPHSRHGLDPASHQAVGNTSTSHGIAWAGVQPHWVTPSRSLDHTSPEILPRLSSPVYMRPVRQFRFPYVQTKARFSSATSHSKASAEPARNPQTEGQPAATATLHCAVEFFESANRQHITAQGWKKQILVV